MARKNCIMRFFIWIALSIWKNLNGNSEALRFSFTAKYLWQVTNILRSLQIHQTLRKRYIAKYFWNFTDLEKLNFKIWLSDCDLIFQVWKDWFYYWNFYLNWHKKNVSRRNLMWDISYVNFYTFSVRKVAKNGCPKFFEIQRPKNVTQIGFIEKFNVEKSFVVEL